MKHENEEIAVKLNRVRSFLESEKLDAVYLKRQDNFSWLTAGGSNRVGIAGEMGNCGLLVTGSKTFAVTNNIESSRMIREERLEEKGFPVRSTIWHEEKEAALVDELVKGGKLGADFPFPGAVNVMAAFKPLRYSLTEWEIERYKEVGRLASLALEETAATARPGQTENQVMGSLAKRLWDQGMDFATVMSAADNRISDYRHAIPTDQVIQKRLMIGGNMRKLGLVVCATRFVQFESPSETLRKQYRDNVEIDCVFMKNTLPGRSIQYPFEKGRAAYKERGVEKEFDLHHQGGPIGYQPRDFRVGFANEEVIQENQAFCWNPSITGTKSEDTILVSTHRGVEFISQPIIFPTITVDVGGQSFTRPDILVK